MLQWIFENKRQ